MVDHGISNPQSENSARKVSSNRNNRKRARVRTPLGWGQGQAVWWETGRRVRTRGWCGELVETEDANAGEVEGGYEGGVHLRFA